jgi:hypothetical protein
MEPDRPQMITRRMRCACRTTKAKNTHSEYVIHIAFPRQQGLRERASVTLYVPCGLLINGHSPFNIMQNPYVDPFPSLPSARSIPKDHKSTMHKAPSLGRCFVARQP